MRINRTAAIITSLAIAVSLMAASAFKAAEPVRYTNLKVLPKNISAKELQGIMVDDFQDALGVNCSFCHAGNKNGRGLDFASDARPEKEIARQMMRMTIGINKKYLKVKHPKIGSDALVVSCNTCHKGQPFPDGVE
ncbi:c-type cytochrome [Mucilaginibacter sp. UR6-11]|uniref:c-type cytochrome n=1 Tax=Mucilaginibacter sp. UR6-11 TaxID=1435644 RepID=UPI001E4550E0|nr:c-type cytochrome [Mucilaginibacter sp. UR6-11]MCC8425059.1 c-type cytochrome [Mucilaginibacter sp. UR6-11]